MVEKSLDRKLARILADRSCRDFILADAKDADMAFGLSAPGRSPEHHAREARFRTLDEYRQLIREIVAQGLVDIMLMSASSNEMLTIRERLFDASHVTPAVRANDTTDIWLAAGSGRYAQQPSQPFRTATLDHIMCGKVECAPDERRLGADLGLYSVTFNNDVALDLRTLEAYKAFRLEAEAKGFRHFLEVFDPNACGDHPPADLARFVNDHIVRTLAGVTSRGRPVFLKIPYHGPAAMEALARYDSSLVVGILGGSAGTTLRRLPHALGSQEVRCARGPLRPKDQQRRAPVDLHPLPAAGRRRRNRTRRRRSGLSRRSGQAGHPAVSDAGRRPAAHGWRHQLRRHQRRTQAAEFPQRLRRPRQRTSPPPNPTSAR